MVRSQQPLIALEGLVQIPERNRHVAHPFFHHRNVDVGGCRVRVLGTTDEIKQVQSTMDIPAEKVVKGFKICNHDSEVLEREIFSRYLNVGR
jgi:hypothetical protein